MGRRANVSCLCLTVLVTLATTVVVGVAVLSDYWEIVRYSSETVSKIVCKSIIRKENRFPKNIFSLFFNRFCQRTVAAAEGT